MGTDFLIGIGIGIAAIVVILGLRFLIRPKELEMTPYSASQTDESSYFDNTAVTVGDFIMIVEDVFMIKGRGLVVTGKVLAGSISVGQCIRLSSPDGLVNIDSIVKDIEAFRKKLRSAQTGESIGILLPELTKKQVKQGMEIRTIS